MPLFEDDAVDSILSQVLGVDIDPRTVDPATRELARQALFSEPYNGVYPDDQAGRLAVADVFTGLLQTEGTTGEPLAAATLSPTAELSQQITSDIALAGGGGGALAVDPIVQQIAASGGSGTSVLEQEGYVEIQPGRWVLFDDFGEILDDVELSTEGGLPKGFVSVGTKIYDIRSGEPVLFDSGGRDGFAAPRPPNLQTITDERTGRTFTFNPQTGETQPLGQFNFPGIDPATTAQEQVRQFDLGAAEDIRQFDVEAAENIRQFDVGIGFDTAQTAATLEQQRAIEQANLAEIARGTNLETALGGFQSINQLAPQLGQLALANAGFTRDVLRNPSDFLARAFFQRGGESPLPVISQADVINQLRSNIGGFQGALNQFSIPEQFVSDAPSFGFQIPQSGFNFQIPQGGTTAAAPTPQTSQFSPEQQTAIDQFLLDAQTATSQIGPPSKPATTAPAPIITARAPAPTRIDGLVDDPTLGQALKHGGTTKAGLLRVGEEGAELIANPTNAPLAVATAKQTKRMDKRGVPGFQGGTFTGSLDQDQQAVAGFLTDRPTTDFATGGQSFFFEGEPGAQTLRTRRPTAATTPAPVTTPTPSFDFSGGGVGDTGFFDKFFTAPQLPSPDPVSQEELRRMAVEFSPPAVSDLFANRTPSSLQFDFSLFTPQQLGTLTQAEREALNTRLAFEGPGGTTLADVETSIRQRFGRKRARPRARQQAGFAF